MEINEMIELFERRKKEREQKMADFYLGDGKYLVVQNPGGSFYNKCNTVPDLVAGNLESFANWLRVDYTDDLPYLEPWFGVGVYANAFGCEYMWRENESPATHYKYLKIDEVKNIEYPDWRKSPVMQTVLNGIDSLKEQTKGQLPIALTDTQSPFDTATLILDATEFFTACYTDEEIVMDFMGKITDLIIEFSKVQIERIGKELLAKPGHLMPSGTFLNGISLSDDNLAVSSPHINQKIALPFNDKISKEFGGLAVHSCGVWAHTMKLLTQYDDIYMVECALSKECDPNPNKPSEARDALKGSGMILKTRVGGNLEEIDKILDDLAAPDLKLIVQIAYNEEDAEKKYKFVNEKLAAIYG